MFVNAPFLSLPPFLCLPSSPLSPSLFSPHLRARCWCFFLSFRREDKLGGGRDSRTCQGTDNPRASPPQAIAIASYPKAVSRSPLAPASSGLPKMPACDCWRLGRRPPDPSFSRVGSSAAIRRLVNKWAWETLSGRKLPRAGARGGYWRGPDFCGQSKHAAPGWEFAFGRRY